MRATGRRGDRSPRELGAWDAQSNGMERMHPQRCFDVVVFVVVVVIVVVVAADQTPSWPILHLIDNPPEYERSLV